MTSILGRAPVIPVVDLDDAAHAVPLARALKAGDIGIMEITLRSDAALAAIEHVAADVPDMLVGAGTVTTPGQVAAAVRAGAGFLVSPGHTPTLLDAMAEAGPPVLPGVATVSEVLGLLERGISAMKFFPAEASGGRAFLNAIAGPVPQARFCPTGGITADTAADYLALPNVGCVGGSWLTPRDVVRARDWRRITELAHHAAALAGTRR